MRHYFHCSLIVTYYSSINHLDLDTTVFEADYEKEANLSLDEMSETDKLRNQMFKVNRKSFIQPFNASFMQTPTFLRPRFSGTARRSLQDEYTFFEKIQIYQSYYF